MKGLMILVTIACVLEIGAAVYIRRKSVDQHSQGDVQQLKDLLSILKKSLDEDENIYEPAKETQRHEEDSPVQRSESSNDDIKISFKEADAEGQMEEKNVKRNLGQNLVMKKESFDKRALSSEAAAFVKVHNDKRRIVSPKATNMKEMVWDSQLESIARDYAKKCNFKHNDARSSSVNYYVGENLYVSTGNISPDVAVTSWDNEKTDYDFEKNVCDPNSKYGCGHYTQVVWAESEKLGCVKQYCSAVQNFNDRNGNPLPGYLVVCNYGPGGNVNRRRPFSPGTSSCGSCPSGYTCVDRLCSKSSGGTSTGGTNPCDTNPCKNGGACSAEGGKAVCKCASGWTGSTCENQETTTTNPCATNPCLNGGTCSVVSGKAKCTCTSEWTDSLCQTLASSVTYSITMICDFEYGMCYNDPTSSWRRFNYFTWGNTRIDPPQGNVFAITYTTNYSGIKYVALQSQTLPETEVTLSFKYRLIGSAKLTLVYKEAGKPQVNKVIAENDSQSWKDFSGSIPAGKDTYFYLLAALPSYSAVAVDDIQYHYTSW